jgi:hypothetical protein
LKLVAVNRANPTPKLRQEAARQRATIALRTSQDVAPAAIFADLDAAGVPASEAAEIRLKFCLSRGQREACPALVNAINPDDLAGASIYPFVRNVLIAENRLDEANLLEEARRTKVRSYLAEAWLEPTLSDLPASVIRGAMQLGDPALLSEAWFEHVQSSLRNEYKRAEFAMCRNRYRGDWAGLLKSADSVLQLSPTLFDAYFDRGLAHLRLGDRAAAQADLRLFLDRCSTSSDYPEALTLYSECTAAPESVRK